MSALPAADGGAAIASIAAKLRRGDLAGARREGEAALAAAPEEAALLQLTGVACCRAGNLEEGAGYLKQAFVRRPELPRLREDLATALAMVGDAEGALALCAADSGAELLRLRGWLLQAKGDAAGAVDAYERLLAGNPRDWEMWNNLGNARRLLGDTAGAIEALERAVSLEPRSAPAWLNYATALAAGERIGDAVEAAREAAARDPRSAETTAALAGLLRQAGRESEALGAFEKAAALAPRDALLRIEIGRLRWALRDEAGAEAAYREALALDPAAPAAWLELGILYERSNRSEAISALLQAAAAAGVTGPELGHLRAVLLRRAGRLEEALAAVEAAPADLEAERRAAMIARLADALGRPAEAFAAFAEMNGISAATPAGRAADPARYRARIDAMIATATPAWFARWRPQGPGERPAPVFLVGFPRSGTTLLDTFLMGHPAVHVLEEEPVLERAEAALGGFARLPDLAPTEIERLRGAYFEALDAVAPEAAGKTVVDKLPLNIVGIPLIHRLFPEARILLSLRHPCDAVLSCFMQAFEPNDAMANFLDLRSGAALYDRVFTFWEQCRSHLPLTVHPIRYEELVVEAETEMRRLIGFLGLDWDPRLLDHRRTAAARGTIKTPSYRQVTEPLTLAAVGRWERYREQMEPVLPLLCAWAGRLGYPPCG